MKKKTAYCRILFFVGVAMLFSSCHKKTAEEILKENLQKCATVYVSQELQVTEVDSVVISRVDTVTERGYAAMTLEMLENLGAQYKMMYDEATLSNDSRVDNLEIYLRQIDKQTDYFRNILDTDAADYEKLLLYMISASYYKDGKAEEFICFAYPDYELHVLDPFGDNLLQQ